MKLSLSENGLSEKNFKPIATMLQELLQLKELELYLDNARAGSPKTRNYIKNVGAF